MRTSIGITSNHVIERDDDFDRCLTISSTENWAAGGTELNLFLGSADVETVAICDVLIEKLVEVRARAIRGLAGAGQVMNELDDHRNREGQWPEDFRAGDRVQVRGEGSIGRVVNRPEHFPELVQVQFPGDPGISTFDRHDLTAYAEEDVPSTDLAAGEHFAGMPSTLPGNPYGAPLPACPWGAVDSRECAMVRERSVAGKSNTIPSCPRHGSAVPA